VLKLKVLATIFFLPNRYECSSGKTPQDLGTLHALVTVNLRVVPVYPDPRLVFRAPISEGVERLEPTKA
jgi:hypothetical protein